MHVQLRRNSQGVGEASAASNSLPGVEQLWLQAITTMHEAHKTNNCTSTPLKHTLTAIHHGWVELTPVRAEIEQTSTAGSEDVRFLYS